MKTIIVKHESICEFFNTHSANTPESDRIGMMDGPGVRINDPHLILRNKTMYIKKDSCDVNIGDKIHVMYDDCRVGVAGTDLRTHFKYEILEYDDVLFICQQISQYTEIINV